MKIVWRSGFEKNTGYTKQAYNTVKELQKLCNVKVDPVFHQPSYQDIQYFNKDRDKDVDFCINNMPAPMIIPGAKWTTREIIQFPRCKNIAYTMIETVELTQEWIDSFKFFREIWVPCTYNYNHISKYAETYLVPEGVDFSLYKVNLEPLNLFYRPKFLFGSTFVWSGRKNPEGLIRAFSQEFSREDVGLLIVTRRDCDLDHEYRLIVENMTDYNKNVFVINSISEELMPNFYNTIDCYVTATRGEGWGLPLLEAMSCKIPLIAPYNTAMKDYLNDKNSFLVESKDIIEANSCRNIHYFYQNCHFFEPSITELRKQMRYVYENYSEAKKKAEQAYLDIKQYSWRNVAHIIYNRLQNL